MGTFYRSTLRAVARSGAEKRGCDAEMRGCAAILALNATAHLVRSYLPLPCQLKGRV